MEPPNILQQTQSDIHSQTVISIPFRNAIFTLPSRLTVILPIVAFQSSFEKTVTGWSFANIVGSACKSGL